LSAEAEGERSDDLKILIREKNRAMRWIGKEERERE